jgi:CheY-like chemotaxis protein
MKKYCILLIDDDESAHEVLGEYLDLAGFRVLHAMDGAMGLQMMGEYAPDLVLLDVNMPVMDGFKTMEAIARDRELKEIPVLFLTSLDRYNLKVKGLELGAEDYIVKPYNKAELLARVNAALRRGMRYRRNERAVEGSLADLSLAELLQTLDIGRKTACIHLKEIGGSICVRDGSIVYSVFRDFSGPDAVTRLFFLEKGTFSISFDLPSEELKQSPMSIQKTIFQTMTYIDELKAIAIDVSKENCLIDLKDAAQPDFMKFNKLFPLKLYDLLVMMEGDLKNNALKISRALKENKLTLVL